VNDDRDPRFAALERFDRWRGTAVALALSPLLILALAIEIGLHVYGLRQNTPPPAWAERVFNATFACIFPSLFACCCGSFWWLGMRAAAAKEACSLAVEQATTAIKRADRVGPFRTSMPDEERLVLRRTSLPWPARLPANGALLAAATFFLLDVLINRFSLGTLAFSPVLFVPIAVVALLVNWSVTWTIRLHGPSVHILLTLGAARPFRKRLFRMDAPVSGVLVSRGLVIQDSRIRAIITGLDGEDLGKVQARRIARWLEERGALDTSRAEE
jgi:hypothetical protein